MARLPVDRDRILRTLTFWLRPDFVLRVVGRFQRVAGFDRAIALASSAFTALIPLLIFTSAILPRVGGDGAADDIIERYDLDGDAAEAVQEMFSPNAGVEHGDRDLRRPVPAARRAQLHAHDAAAVRADLGAAAAERAQQPQRPGVDRRPDRLQRGHRRDPRRCVDHGPLELASALVLLPLSAAFLIWSGYMLSARRVPLPRSGPVRHRRGACSSAIYSIGASIYMPHLFDSYANRYGVIGVVFALISGALRGDGRDRRLRRARPRGPRRARRASGAASAPSDRRGAQREWDEIITEGRARWAGLREQVERRRGGAARAEGRA